MSADPTGHLHRLARFLAAFLDELGPNLQPIDELVHDRRFPDVAQTSALEFLFPICSVPGCTQAFGLERDHLRPWSDTGETRLTDLDRKCGQHHGENGAGRTATAASPPVALGAPPDPPPAFLDNCRTNPGAPTAAPLVPPVRPHLTGGPAHDPADMRHR